jgi:hypothetical protein
MKKAKCKMQTRQLHLPGFQTTRTGAKTLTADSADERGFEKCCAKSAAKIYRFRRKLFSEKYLLFFDKNMLKNGMAGFILAP